MQNIRTRIKICGIRDKKALEAAINAGADAVGLMLYESSRRYIDVDTAQKLAEDMPAFVNKVAVLVNADYDFVDTVIEKIRPDYLQFHGDETAQFCQQFHYPYIKALAMHEHTNLAAIAHDFNKASALLVDTYSQDSYGGIGETFNWDWLVSQQESYVMPVILAGGLNVDNVGQAIARVRPYAVDVSSGVEHDGNKDSAKIQAFCREVRRVNGY